MKSALELIAFSQGDRYFGTMLLLQIALEALDRDGQRVAAAYVDLAMSTFSESWEALLADREMALLN